VLVRPMLWHQLAVAAKPDTVDVGFWRAVLGYEPMAEDNGVDPLGHGSTVWMQDLDPDKPLRHAMHVDVSVASGQISARVAAALAAGGRVVDEAAASASSRGRMAPWLTTLMMLGSSAVKRLHHHPCR